MKSRANIHFSMASCQKVGLIQLDRMQGAKVATDSLV
jgi:hypothetical protein